MKKIYYLVSLAILAFFTSCTDFNATNFPGYNEAAIPTNLATYNYTLTSTDYTNISKAALAKATNANDSAIALLIGSKKYFLDTIAGSAYVPLLLATKYIYADEKSVAMITYNKEVPYDTTKIANLYKLTLNDSDYVAMGTGTNQPGKYKNFSSVIDPNFYIPIWLKLTKQLAITPYLKAGEVRLIRYKYYVGPLTEQRTTVFVYDGTNWSNYVSVVPLTEKFSFKDKVWQFIDSEVFVEKFAADFGTFTPYIITGTYTWTWASYNGGCFVGNAYQKGDTEIWMVSPVIDLKERVNPTLSFDHAINYAAGLPLPDLAGVYASTNFTGDVATATWTKLDLVYPTVFSWTFVNSGKISLLPYANQKIVIGFKYVSTGTAIGWEVSNINVLDE